MRWFGKMGLAPLVTSMFSPDKSFDRQGLTIFALSSFNELRCKFAASDENSAKKFFVQK